MYYIEFNIQNKLNTSFSSYLKLFSKYHTKSISTPRRNKMNKALSFKQDHKPILQVTSAKWRRSSQYEYISSKQRRLMNVAPETYIQQNIAKKAKKLRRLRIHCKFLSSKRQSTTTKLRKHLSKSMHLISNPKIKHKRSKTTGAKPDLETFIPIGDQLNAKIVKILKARFARKIKRQRTLKEVKGGSLLSKELLLNYQKMMREEQSQELSDGDVSQQLINTNDNKKINNQTSRKSYNNISRIDLYMRVRLKNETLTTSLLNNNGYLFPNSINKHNTHQKQPSFPRIKRQQTLQTEFLRDQLSYSRDRSQLQHSEKRVKTLQSQQDSSVLQLYTPQYMKKKINQLNHRKQIHVKLFNQM